MKRTLFLSIAALVLAAVATPELHAQRASRGRGQGQGQQLRKRDGACTPGHGRGQGVRKQDGTGPKGGTADCPKTPKAEPKK